MKWTRNVFLFSLFVGALACGDAGGDAPPIPDGGTFRDATVVDGAWLMDASPRDAGGRADAGAAADAGGPSCGWTECDPLEDTCDGDTSCRLTVDGTMCAEPGTTAIAEGGACTSSDECAPGLDCFRRGDGGVCGRPCCPGRDDVCDGETSCNGPGVLVDGTDSEWWSCVPARACQPLAAGEACEPGEGCYIVSSTGDTDCRRAGAADVGDSCAEQSDCAPGLFCAGLSSPTCVRICSLGDAGTGATCPSGEGSCRAYSHSPPGTGLCTIEMAARAR